MRPGLPLSATLHAALLVWALVSFASQPPLVAPPSDPIDVELLPPTDVSQPKLGSKTAKSSDSITPKDAKASTKEADGKRVGESKVEEPPPPPPEAKPTPPVEAKPLPETKPDPKPPQVAAVPPEPVPEAKPEPPKKPEPKPEPPKPVVKTEPPAPQPKPDAPVEADKAKETAEGKPPEVKQPPKDEKALDKLIEAKTKDEPKKEEPKKEPPKKPDPKPAEKPAPKAEPVKTASLAAPAKPSSAPSKPSPTKSTTSGELTDIKNRVDTASASSRTEQRASLGSPTAPVTNLKLSQSEMEALIGMLRSQISACWSPPIGAAESGVITTLVIQLNQDGTLKADPQIQTVSPDNHPQAVSIANSAVRAVKRCASEKPFKLPPDKYAAWAVNHVTFDPKNQ